MIGAKSLTMVRRPDESWESKHLLLLVLSMMDERRVHNRDCGPWSLRLSHTWGQRLFARLSIGSGKVLVDRLREINRIASVQVDPTLPDFGVSLVRVGK